MKTSKRHLLLLGLCAAGLAVFAYDHFRGEPSLVPEVASAVAAAPPTEIGPVAPSPAASSSGSADRFRSALADRLKALATADRLRAEDMRDAFRPAASWGPVAAPTPQPSDDLDKAKADAFARKHALQAVMVGPDGRQAVIDTTCLKIGQRIDDFQLVSVGDRSAVMVSPEGIRVTFELPGKDDPK